MFYQLNKFVFFGLVIYIFNVGVAIAMDDSKIAINPQLKNISEMGFIKVVGSVRGGKIPEVKRSFNEAANPKQPPKPPKANPPPSPGGTSGGPKPPSYTPKGF